MALRNRQIRHQLFLGQALSERLEALAAKPGATKSAILADALTAWLNQKGTTELDNRFGSRLDRISGQLNRIERNGQIQIEVLALFVRYMLASIPPVPDNDAVGRAKGRERFDWFTTKVARSFKSGANSFVLEEAP